jgi:hypothetical protein
MMNHKGFDAAPARRRCGGRWRAIALAAGCLWLGVLGNAGRAQPSPSPPATGRQMEFDRLRLDQVQVIGTHNSYHVAADEVADRLMRGAVPREADANAYSHLSLAEQLNRLGVRKLELDLFLDPAGGRYADPLALRVARQQGVDVPPHDPLGKLMQPGIKVLHSPDFDFRTTVYTLADALAEVRAWSDANQGHFPVFIQLELKKQSFWPGTRPPRWDAAALAELEQEILAILPPERILSPDRVRGEHSTLREAIEQRGWPTVAEAAGKVVLLLDNEDEVRQTYLEPSRTLAGRLMFVSVAREHPAAAWMKRNDPVRAFGEIQDLVRAGFLVRTRADVETVAARSGDVRRRDAAIASGAQLISTDFPEADPRWPDYVVRFAEGRMWRSNPVSGANGNDDPKAVDSTADSGAPNGTNAADGPNGPDVSDVPDGPRMAGSE